MNSEYFIKRKSCRFFKDLKITKNLLEEIIIKAMKAPTCGNMQLYTVVATRDEEKLKEMAAYHYNQPAATTAPLILTVCADFNKFTKWCEANEAEAGYNNFHSFITAMTDAVIFAQQIVTVAENEGLGSCYLGTVTYNATQISRMLELPELVVPVAAIALGYVDKEGEDTKRMPVEGILHDEKYNDRYVSALTPLFSYLEDNPENEKFIKENGKKNIAQVFAEIRYPKSTNESISKEFYSLLQEKGYMK